MKAVKTLILAAAVAAAGAAMAGDRLDAIQKSGVIRVGTPADYRPFAMDEAGVIKGHDVDVIKAMAAYAGWKVEFVKTARLRSCERATSRSTARSRTSISLPCASSRTRAARTSSSC